MLRRIALGLLMLSIGTQIAHAQQPPLKWGDIPDEHLHMTTYAPDTNAAAVILADYGSVYFRDLSEIVLERHVRVKILRESAYDDWGTVVIPYFAEEKSQQVTSIKGQTFTVGANGKVKRHKLDKKSIFREDVDGSWERIRFTLPALEPGAVIEYRYKKTFDSPMFLPSWQFQYDEPVLWSEYRAEIPNRLRYVSASTGVGHFDIHESHQAVRPYGDAQITRWVMQDVPALRLEPFMTTPKDYRAALSFQLTEYYHPGQGFFVKVVNTWDELADELLSLHSFGGQLRGSGDVRREAKFVTRGLDELDARMKAVYDFVRTAITYDGNAGIFADRDVDDVLKTRTGSSPEIALLLVSMLREVGVAAHPVLISTRSHGRVLQSYPLLDQFNDVLAYARIGDQVFLLDATDERRPYDLLPVSALNGAGWLVEDGNPRWIGIEATGRYRHQASATLTLDATGTLTGTLSTSDAGYAALAMRHGLKEADDADAFVRDVLLDGLPDAAVEGYTFDNEDAVDETLHTQTEVTVPGYAQAAGDFLYLNPVVFDRMDENPLRLPERSFPVDFAYPSDRVYSVRLQLPDGYVVEELPAPLKVELPLQSGYFQRRAAETDGVLTVQLRFRVDRAVFPPHAYPDLRAAYDRVVAAHSDQVVLRRAPAEAPGAEPAADPAAEAEETTSAAGGEK